MSKTINHIASIHEDLNIIASNISGIGGTCARRHIASIENNLDKISGLDGIYDDKIKEVANHVRNTASTTDAKKVPLNVLARLARDIHKMVEDVLENDQNACQCDNEN